MQFQGLYVLSRSYSGIVRTYIHDRLTPLPQKKQSSPIDHQKAYPFSVVFFLGNFCTEPQEAVGSRSTEYRALSMWRRSISFLASLNIALETACAQEGQFNFERTRSCRLCSSPVISSTPPVFVPKSTAFACLFSISRLFLRLTAPDAFGNSGKASRKFVVKESVAQSYTKWVSQMGWAENLSRPHLGSPKDTKHCHRRTTQDTNSGVGMN
ncbi:hypothetical protein BX600DRAFT_230361 [Xylariales sp. PMI_506]|nr:hypothetical protein BX600DRAFT_230361 [Xylariales sp. PMI_506]